MTPRQKKITATVAVAVGGPLLVLMISAAARDEVQLRTRVTKLEAARVTDSTGRADDRAVLLRIDQRVQEIYCAGKPPGCR